MSQTLFTALFGLNELRIEVANKADLAFTLTCNRTRTGNMAWMELPRSYQTARGAKLAAARIVGEPVQWNAATQSDTKKGKDMVDFNEKQQKILDGFGLGNVARAEGNSFEPLRCYQVGDCDWFAASSPEEALTLMREIVGDEDGWDPEDYEVELTSEELLDKRWVEEDEPGNDAGSLREWLAAASEPGWISGTEP